MTHPSPYSGQTAEGIPVNLEVREQLRDRAVRRVKSLGLSPPLTLDALTVHATAIVDEAGAGTSAIPYASVLINNALWASIVAAVPYDRRVLLLPQCLRNRAACPAPSDQFGLLCAGCGTCSIDTLQRAAEALGYVTVVAEGTTLVTELVREGTVDAVIGVSCLESLAKSFPSLAAEALPALAVPLLTDGCEDTVVDAEDVLTLIRLRTETAWSPDIRIDRLRAHVDGWFTDDELRPLLCTEDVFTERVALEWLTGKGKHWRPLLAYACALALLPHDPIEMGRLRRIGVAVECFHKASLAHDDIEDQDDYRYGQATLHRRHGVPIALNAGDLLIGWGYRLLAELNLPAESVRNMLQLASVAHTRLCLGQGEELDWIRSPYRITVRKMLEIFRWKTAPAFEVGLRMGATYAKADSATEQVLLRFCDLLGTAYQIRDDIDDFDHLCSAAHPLQPSLLIALAFEHGSEDACVELETILRNREDALSRGAKLRRIVDTLGLREYAEAMYREHRSLAFQALDPLAHVGLKRLLHRIASRILP